MKKLLFTFVLIAGVTMVTTAQTQVVKDEKTVKKTSTVPQKVHNTFSKHKKYSGKKVKHVKTVETTGTAK